MSLKSQNIPLSGLSTSPSDYSVPDGHLSAAIGVVHEEGAIHNAVHTAPKVEYTMPSNLNVIYIHRNSEYTHLIVEKKYKYEGKDCYAYFYFDPNEDSTITSIPDLDFRDYRYFRTGETERFINVISIGNVLRFTTVNNTIYYRWKQELSAGGTYSDNKYILLGSKLPELKISFGLSPHYYVFSRDRKTVKFYTANFSGSGVRVSPMLKEEEVESITNATFGIVNEFQDGFCNKNGYFSQPFLVRYGYRLYDGSITMNSSPIFMMPSDTMNPICPIIAYHNRPSIDRNSMTLDCIGVGCSLEYKIINSIKKDLDNWEGIIKSVDFFVSSPLYWYNQSERINTYIAPFRDLDKFTESDTSAVEDMMKESAGNSVCAAIGMDNEDNAITQLKLDSEGEIKRSLYDVLRKSGSIINDGENIEFSGMYFFDEGFLTTLDYYIVQKDLSSTRKIATVRFTPIGGEHPGVDMEVYFDDRSYFPMAYVPLPKSKKDLSTQIKECSSFYLVKSIDVNDLSFNSAFNTIDIEQGVLSSLETNQAMQDEYLSHFDMYSINEPAVYNNRLNVYNCRRNFFDGFSTNQMFQNYDEKGDITYEYYLYINNGNDTLVKKIEGNRHSEGVVFYYPDTNAYRVKILKEESGLYYTSDIQMLEHPFLNGSYAFVMWRNIKWTLFSGNIDDIRNLPKVFNTTGKNFDNRLFTSEVDNPFVFKAENVETVGNGSILALVPSAIALSEGQFGSFPMYAFTEDGIWALSVNSTGGWSSVQPVSRDVPITVRRADGTEHPCILQLDRDIVFATDRGLMMLSGSKVTCISEIFDGTRDQWFSTYSTHLEQLLKKSDIQYSDRLFYPFRQYLTGGNMHYDYSHQRIIVSNPDYPFCFVFGMKDRLWTATSLLVTSAINSYPEAYAMAIESNGGTERNVMIDFTKHDAVDANNIYMPSDGYLLTRPLKLGAPDMLKTIRSINLRGVFTESSRTAPSASFADHKFGMVLYGTNDPAMQTWTIVGSVMGSRMQFRYGSPYKAFRVAIISKMEAGESLSHMEVVYELKETDKVR